MDVAFGSRFTSHNTVCAASLKQCIRRVRVMGCENEVTKWGYFPWHFVFVFLCFVLKFLDKTVINKQKHFSLRCNEFYTDAWWWWIFKNSNLISFFQYPCTKKMHVHCSVMLNPFAIPCQSNGSYFPNVFLG
jgi:hypothetical protein